MHTYLIVLPNGLSTTVEAAWESMAWAVGALVFGLGQLPPTSVVVDITGAPCLLAP